MTQQIRIFASNLAELPDLEAAANEFLETTGSTIISANGQISLPATSKSTNNDFLPASVLLVLAVETSTKEAS